MCIYTSIYVTIIIKEKKTMSEFLLDKTSEKLQKTQNFFKDKVERMQKVTKYTFYEFSLNTYLYITVYHETLYPHWLVSNKH